MKLLQGREQVTTTRHYESFLNLNASSAFANGNSTVVSSGFLALISDKAQNIFSNFHKIEQLDNDNKYCVLA